jgi:hypothetical protein
MLHRVAAAFVVCLPLSCFLLAQSPNATITGRITDPSKAAVTGAKVIATNVDTGIQQSTTTGAEGLYTIVSLNPGDYKLEVEKQGFRTVVKPDIVLHVQDVSTINFEMAVGTFSESITVTGGAPLVNTEDATVTTVVDRNFAENLPLNGRSFQTLIQLTPGVVLTSSNNTDGGQFSVNGQRASSNYWMVDGVSANIGTSSGSNPGNGMGGGLGGFSAVGGTNSMVSVDALQEFRIQTSTYAPEFGRTPGGQISIVTRSGTNQWHGTVFDYLRNGSLDANDWFANEKGLPKPTERQNDFGGTFRGPILKDRTFFFFSYEGLRLQLPTVTLTDVPCDSTCRVFGNLRAAATRGMQPFLNAFPLPNGPEVFDPTSGSPTGGAQFNASYSNPANLDAYSIRIDHKLSEKLSLFGRYNYSPSGFTVRGGANTVSALSVTQPSNITTQTATVGATWIISPTISNDLRFNYSRTEGASKTQLDSFGGAIPLTSLPFPSPFTSQNGDLELTIQSLGTGSHGTGSEINVGPVARNLQRQVNVVDTLYVQRGSHALKFGLDFRRLSPLSSPQAYRLQPVFLDLPSAEAGDTAGANISAARALTLLFRNLGAFAQDTWRVAPRFTITYGLRWDVDFTPASLNGPSIPAVTGYNLTDLSTLAIAPAGTPPFKTTYGNVAPRLGLAYEILQNQNWGMVFRGGFGVFYDLVSSETGNLVGNQSPPFGAVTQVFPPNFPYNPAQIQPPAIPTTGTLSQPYAYNPNLKQPYTLEWNVALQQGLGRNQSVSASYVGAAGRRLLQTTSVLSPPPNIGFGFLVDNTATSDYDALQLQFQRRLSHALQALASYSWAHSLDDGSAGSASFFSNENIPGSGNVNRGASDFDIRNSLSVALTYEVPAPKINALVNAILRGWSVQSIVLARSAPPVDISDQNLSNLFGSFFIDLRPDLVPGQPLYLFGPQYPGRKAFNPAAFTDPPFDPNTFVPLRQGNVPRNFLRGFGATQWDFAVHRDFPIHESVKLQFRAEMFNVLNHPNFGPPNGNFGTNSFGVSSQMLGQSLSGFGSAGSGSLSPLYQIGGPRSVQLALKLQF